METTEKVMNKVNDVLDRCSNEKACDAIEDITSAVKDASEEAQGKMEEIAKAFVLFSVRALKRPEPPGVRRY